ncbi:hypothetical protein [Candidatus Frankia alpina]|uniref:hypothetical protein n=1 Tax=Candidatus Frankia alpina TaxID=2699483 RepID=UPI001F1E5D90|nr:hypothetical protein [Candidatus Frankia alpina]
MGDSFGTTLLVVLGVLVALGLALAVAALVVIRRYDLPLRGTVADSGQPRLRRLAGRRHP